MCQPLGPSAQLPAGAPHGTGPPRTAATGRGSRTHRFLRHRAGDENAAAAQPDYHRTPTAVAHRSRPVRGRRLTGRAAPAHRRGTGRGPGPGGGRHRGDRSPRRGRRAAHGSGGRRAVRGTTRHGRDDGPTARRPGAAHHGRRSPSRTATGDGRPDRPADRRRRGSGPGRPGDGVRGRPTRHGGRGRGGPRTARPLTGRGLCRHRTGRLAAAAPTAAAYRPPRHGLPERPGGCGRPAARRPGGQPHHRSRWNRRAGDRARAAPRARTLPAWTRVVGQPAPRRLVHRTARPRHPDRRARRRRTPVVRGGAQHGRADRSARLHRARARRFRRSTESPGPRPGPAGQARVSEILGSPRAPEGSAACRRDPDAWRYARSRYGGPDGPSSTG